MTALDQALDALRKNLEDPECQSKFYNLFLNSLFYVPTVKEALEIDNEQPQEETPVPMVVEVDGLNYLMLFDAEQRMAAWAPEETAFVTVPGHMIAELSAPDLYWALNVGTEHAKQFVPDEIAWLKDLVGRCKSEIIEQPGPSS